MTQARLDTQRRRGRGDSGGAGGAGGRRLGWVALWDGRQWPARMLTGMPAFDFHCAPSGLLTRRQLRAEGLAPGGQEPYARLVWRRDRRWAWLYREDLARPKRIPTTAQLEAVGKALAARWVCAACGPVGYCVRTTDQLCGDCHTAGVTPSTTRVPTWEVLGGWSRAAEAVT
jgi:hypothetical protein